MQALKIPDPGKSAIHQKLPSIKPPSVHSVADRHIVSARGDFCVACGATFGLAGYCKNAATYLRRQQEDL